MSIGDISFRNRTVAFRGSLFQKLFPVCPVDDGIVPLQNKFSHPRLTNTLVAFFFSLDVSTTDKKTRTPHGGAKCQHCLEVQECLLKRSCLTSSALRGSPMSLLSVFMSHWSLALFFSPLSRSRQPECCFSDISESWKKEEGGRNPLIDAPSFLSTDRRCSHTESHTHASLYLPFMKNEIYHPLKIKMIIFGRSSVSV